MNVCKGIQGNIIQCTWEIANNEVSSFTQVSCKCIQTTFIIKRVGIAQSVKRAGFESRECKDFSLLDNAETGSEAHSAS
jgi:hypothetical protein